MSRHEPATHPVWPLPPALYEAHVALRENVEIAQSDPWRPAYHFMPPSGWMNDPNGTVFHGGYYHLFFQHNPYADCWHNLHWGHARSRDLVTWEHVPIALLPRPELGEKSFYSGSCQIDEHGRPMLFYTRVDIDSEHSREQCAAISDDEMIDWSRHPANPLITVGDGCPPVKPNWRDPFVFETEARTFMVLSAQLTEEAGGDFVVLLFEARDASLEHWEYRNVIMRKPGYTFGFFECPNFFQVGDEWVLLASPFKPVEYYIGSFDLETLEFTPRSHGTLDGGIDFYATNTATAPDGRTVVFAWVRGFRKGHGWNGCLALPREISIDDDGAVVTRPVRELETLRRERVEGEPRTITETELLLSATTLLDTAEIECRFELGTASSVELRLLRSDDGRTGVNIVYDGDTLDVHGTKIFYQTTSEDEAITLRVFVDRSVLEVFVDDGRASVTKVVYATDGGTGVSLRARGGEATLHGLYGWHMAESPAVPERGIEFVRE